MFYLEPPDLDLNIFYEEAWLKWEMGDYYFTMGYVVENLPIELLTIWEIDKRIYSKHYSKYPNNITDVTCVLYDRNAKVIKNIRLAVNFDLWIYTQEPLNDTHYQRRLNSLKHIITDGFNFINH